jgi:hypothetical protein
MKSAYDIDHILTPILFWVLLFLVPLLSHRQHDLTEYTQKQPHIWRMYRYPLYGISALIGISLILATYENLQNSIVATSIIFPLGVLLIAIHLLMIYKRVRKPYKVVGNTHLVKICTLFQLLLVAIIVLYIDNDSSRNSFIFGSLGCCLILFVILVRLILYISVGKEKFADYYFGCPVKTALNKRNKKQ